MAAKASSKTPSAGLDKRTADLESAIAAITKSFGEGSIMRLGDEGANLQIDAVSTGSLGLDIALGVGGVPRGRIIEIYGPESSGKTTVMLHVVANAQKAGGTAAFIDAEHALDPAYAAKLGVNLDELLISQPDSGEEALTICETLARSGALDVIVIDSVAALVPRRVPADGRRIAIGQRLREALPKPRAGRTRPWGVVVRGLGGPLLPWGRGENQHRRRLCAQTAH